MTDFGYFPITIPFRVNLWSLRILGVVYLWENFENPHADCQNMDWICLELNATMLFIRIFREIILVVCVQKDIIGCLFVVGRYDDDSKARNVFCLFNTCKND